MELEWVAESKAVVSRNAFIQQFDMEKYNELLYRYNGLSKDEKSRFKGTDDYIVKNGGPDITPKQ